MTTVLGPEGRNDIFVNRRLDHSDKACFDSRSDEVLAQNLRTVFPWYHAVDTHVPEIQIDCVSLRRENNRLRAGLAHPVGEKEGCIEHVALDFFVSAVNELILA